jgi:DNA-directed RNA polymerase specialized sigma24 family protein
LANEKTGRATVFKKSMLMGGLTCFVAINAWGLDEAGTRYVKMLANGGPSSMRSAAESIYNTGNTDQDVLDAAAETLLTNYRKNPTSETYADAMAWLCRALGNSSNARYKSVVEEVANNAESRKLKKHCDRAAGDLPKADGAGYVAGSFDLSKYKEGASAAAPAATAAAAPAAAAAAAPAGPGKGFSVVKEGMSREEVEALIGVPTAVSSHITGKAFRPFNFKGSDTHRVNALYKGVGRIIYSNSSAYSSTYRVVEIVEDSSESGYP